MLSKPFGEGILYRTPRSLFIEPLRPRSGTFSSYILEIEQKSHQLSFSRLSSVGPKAQILDFRDIYGILGTVRLISGPHLIIAERRTICGSILGSPIFCLSQISVLPINLLIPLTESERKQETYYLENLTGFLNTGNLYTCYDFPLTESYPRLVSMLTNQKDPASQNPFAFWESADDRFFYNKAMAHDFLSSDLHHWIIPVIYGHVSYSRFLVSKTPNGHFLIENSKLPAKSLSKGPYVHFSISLIARKSRHRAGYRYITRGANMEGYCANFLETEQIVSLIESSPPLPSHLVLGNTSHITTLEDDLQFPNCCSFLQIRGSIPILWGQRGFKYKPLPIIVPNQSKNISTINNHFNDVCSTYGDIHCINLLKQDGAEEGLGTAFQYYCTQHVKNTKNTVTYQSWDFHDETKSKFSNVLNLIQLLSPYLNKFGVFSTFGNNILSKQTGNIRTNCLDCLDRTNVLQTYIGLHMITRQLHQLIGQSKTSPCAWFGNSLKFVFNHPLFHSWMKNSWADHGDAASKLYAGTPALKGEFARAGKRTLPGFMQDGMNSVTRYYINNFKDSEKQLAVDIFHAFFTPQSATSLIRHWNHLPPTRRRYLMKSFGSFNAFCPPPKSVVEVDHSPWLPEAKDAIQEAKTLKKFYKRLPNLRGKLGVGSSTPKVVHNDEPEDLFSDSGVATFVPVDTTETETGISVKSNFNVENNQEDDTLSEHLVSQGLDQLTSVFQPLSDQNDNHKAPPTSEFGQLISFEEPESHHHSSSSSSDDDDDDDDTTTTTTTKSKSLIHKTSSLPSSSVNYSSEEHLISEVLSMEAIKHKTYQTAVSESRDRCIENPSVEQFCAGWFLISINHKKREQERVFLLTTKAYYRVKLVYKNNSFQIQHHHRIPLESVSAIQVGPIFKSSNIGKIPKKIKSKSSSAASSTNSLDSQPAIKDHFDDPLNLSVFSDPKKTVGSPLSIRIYTNGYGIQHQDPYIGAKAAGWIRWPSSVDKQPFRTYRLMPPLLTRELILKIMDEGIFHTPETITKFWDNLWSTTPEMQVNDYQEFTNAMKFVYQKSQLPPISLIERPIPLARFKV